MRFLLSLSFLMLIGCTTPAPPPISSKPHYYTFSDAIKLIQDNTEPVILKDGDCQVIVTPEYAGRVMGSTLDGEAGLSMGLIKPEVIKGKDVNKQFVNYGGAERLWLAPEGGQFALYFKPNADFSFTNWSVPQSFNNTLFPVKDKSSSHVTMGKKIELINWSNTQFRLYIERTISLIKKEDLNGILNCTIPGDIKVVAYKSTNTLRNIADEPMTKDKGLISLWILSQFVTEGDVQVIAPYVPDNEGGSGIKVKSNYFGEIPSDRLTILENPPVIMFKCDGKKRSKIGISPQRTTGIIGSIDWKRNILTIVKSPDVDKNGMYANNAWEPQDDPFTGSAINSYNDGPYGLKSSFYELESLSPVKELKKGEEISHEQITVHFKGPISDLNKIAMKTLGVDLTKCSHL